ncbi:MULTISPECIES: hypothetical protein [Methylotenera]|uniref:hypothetical protein n=1 Tax=Methylotenera TaxID=359407 RepID=UPI00038020B9|nr:MULTISPECIES: hypothetical protein [Methylotenera]
MQNISKYLVLTLIMTGLFSACDKPKESATEPTAQPSNNTDAAPNADPAIESPVKNNDPEVINFEGFGPAKFGDNEESVRISWGRPLNASKPAVGATCYYLYLDPKPENHQEIAFMFEDGKFVRYDVDDPKWVAPGNIVVGDTMAKVLQAHAGHIQNQPHKYIEGAHTLVVTPLEKSNASLIFETDANNIVINWRIGVSPQVYYVEGCS